MKKTDTGSPAKLAADRHYAREAALNKSRAQWVGDLYEMVKELLYQVEQDIGRDDPFIEDARVILEYSVDDLNKEWYY